MNRPSFFFSALVAPFIAGLAVAACSGGMVPVAQDGSDAGSNGSSGASGASGSSGASGTSGGTSSSGGSGSSGTSGGTSSSGSSGANDGGAACPADAGGNSCFCGDLICKDGKWVCGPCTNDAGPATSCSPPCGSNQVCVKDQIVGGAVLLPDDAGACPAGYHVNGNHCELDPTFACVGTPKTCTGVALDCTCAATVCTSQSSCSYQCQSTSPGQVNCLCQAP